MKISEKISLTPLKKIDLDDGDILHALKKSDPGYAGFGEAYFSFIKFNAIKAWKLHKEMTLNLIVPVGEVRFVFFSEQDASFLEVEIGKKNYQRITVQPEIWFGFKGIHESTSIIINIANIEHNPDEGLKKSINEFNYEW